MVTPTFITFVNHLLAQEPWAVQQLQIHAGKVACIDVELYALRVQIASDGMLQMADLNQAHGSQFEQQAQVTIRLKMSDVPLIMQNRERAFSYVKIEGDADFANTISQLSKDLRWEFEEDLSHVVGDVAAVRLVAIGKNLIKVAQSTHQKLQENAAEYFLEENPMLVRPTEVRMFGEQVNKTRDDVERMMKRIEKLEKAK
jgi:ubiquinone biosynthesis protein UbiJ